MKAIIIFAQVLFYSFFGLGDYATSPGVTTTTQEVNQLKGTTVRGPYDWASYPDVEAQIAVDHAKHPASAIVLYGYSCGNKSITQIPNDMPGLKFQVVGTQASDWFGCWPSYLSANVTRAQLTYNADCWATFFFGCAMFAPADRRLTVIQRPDSHGYADIDPDAQRDVVRFVQSALVALPGGVLRTGPQFLIKYKGE